MSYLRYDTDAGNIRSIFKASDYDQLADDTAYAYGLSAYEPDIAGMRACADADVYDSLEDDFVYWAYACAILEDIIEDPDGYRSDDYVNNPDALAGLLDDDGAVNGSCDALAYARCKLMFASPTEVRAMMPVGEIERILNRLRDGGATDADCERVTGLVQEMWAQFAS